MKSSRIRSAVVLVIEALEGRSLFSTTALNCPNNPNDFANGTDASGDGNTDGDTDCGNTDQPVNDLSGVPVVQKTDLAADSFGGTLSYTRTWTGLNNTGSNGNGWTPSTNPYLYVYSVFDPQTKAYDKPVIAYVDSNQNTHLFDLPNTSGSTSATARFYGQEKLSYDAGTTKWTVTDTNGNTLIFNDLPRDSSGNVSADPTVGYHNQGTFGKVIQSTDAGACSRATPITQVGQQPARSRQLIVQTRQRAKQKSCSLIMELGTTHLAVVLR